MFGIAPVGVRPDNRPSSSENTTLLRPSPFQNISLLGGGGGTKPGLGLGLGPGLTGNAFSGATVVGGEEASTTLACDALAFLDRRLNRSNAFFFFSLESTAAPLLLPSALLLVSISRVVEILFFFLKSGDVAPERTMAGGIGEFEWSCCCCSLTFSFVETMDSLLAALARWSLMFEKRVLAGEGGGGRDLES